MRIGIWIGEVQEPITIDAMAGQVRTVAAAAFERAWMGSAQSLGRTHDAGATEVLTIPFGSTDDQTRTLELLASLARSERA